jgi:hypothetical protein
MRRRLSRAVPRDPAVNAYMRAVKGGLGRTALAKPFITARRVSAAE